MRISAIIKIKPDYTCSCCGAIREGTDTYQETCNSTWEIETFMENMTAYPPRPGIPVGWVSNGLDGIKCDNCK